MEMCNYRMNMYKRAAEVIDDVIWEWNINNNTMYFSSKVKELTGYEADYFENLIDFIEKTAAEEDKETLIEDIKACINGNSFFYQDTYKIAVSEVEDKWLQLKGKVKTISDNNEHVFFGRIKDVTENVMLQKQISYMTYYDSLTELPNRVLFFEKLKNLLKRSEIENKQGALIFIDLDNFKAVNDNFGHQYGDLLLKMFAQLLNTLTINNTEAVRLSGDEFVILVYDFKSIKEVEDICDTIFDYLNNKFEIMDKQIYITASIGIAVFPEHSKDANELVKFADFAMYHSKSNGKKQYNFFSKEISDSYFRMSEIEDELKSAIKNHELSIVYQPQIDAVSNTVTGIEALIRWKNKKLGNVAPPEFIPIAEKNGFIVNLGNWIIEEVMSTAFTWLQKGYKLNSISINVSPVQMKDKHFKNTIINSCEKYSIPPNLLEIEITEGTLIEICKEKIEILDEIIKSGINIALDDFGTGYSSLNYLTSLPLNTLKIDKSFIDKIDNDKNIAVIKSIINLSETLNYKIITEGVETKEQLNIITDLGCKIIQGYYFSKPLSKADMELFLLKQNRF